METMHVVELEACSVTFYDDGIVHTHFKDHHLVSPEEVQEMFETIEKERKGRKALLMVSVGEGTTMSNEARAHASSEASCKYIAADAIVVRDFGHQLAANVFVRHHKPHRPIQMFPDHETAMTWLATHRDLIDPV
jgi:predicted ATPase